MGTDLDDIFDDWNKLYDRIRSIYNARHEPSAVWSNNISPKLNLIHNSILQIGSFDFDDLDIPGLNLDFLSAKNRTDLYEEIELEIEFATNVLDGKYNYMNYPKKSWYPSVNFSSINYEGNVIPGPDADNFIQSIKVRKIIDHKLKIKGYPLQAFKKIDFDSGVSLWVPNFYDIAFTKTMELWINDKSQIWRYVYIVYTGSPRIKSLLAMIPWFDVDTAFKYFFYQVPVKINIWQYMAFFNTAHDSLILSNWDRVRIMLEGF